MDARMQLHGFDQAAVAAERAQFVVTPRWIWGLIALLGPSAVWWTSRSLPTVGDAEARFLTIGAVTFGVLAIIGLVLAARFERTSPVRPKSPIRGGPISGWSFLLPASIIFPLMIGTNLVSINEVDRPYLIGAVVFVVMAIGPPYFWKRHIAAVQP